MESAGYRVVNLQMGIAIAGAVLAYFTLGAEAAKAAFYGGMVAFVNGFLFLQKVRQAANTVSTAPSQALGLIYRSAATRFVLMLALFGLGFGYLRLQVPPALGVFAVAQLAYGWGLRQSYKDLL